MQEEIAARLRQARKAVPFKTAKEAAASLAVEYPTYAGHENGNRAMSLEDAILYARRYRISLDWLLTGHGRGPGGIEAKIVGEDAILSFLGRIDTFTDKDVAVAFSVIKNALDVKRAESERSRSHDQPQPANPHHESKPSRSKSQRRDASPLSSDR